MMPNIYQSTLIKPILFKGIGLHSGKISSVKLLPAEAGQGIIFKRTDLKARNIIEANYKLVSSATLCTRLKNKFGVSVSTVEHLLAALYITGVDNVVIEIDSEEVPIMDGSSKEFINLLNEAGKKSYFIKRRYLKVLEKFQLERNGKLISVEPNDTLQINFQLNYQNKIIGKQENKINFSNDNLEDIVSSRTFCLYEDIEKIKDIGLAKGGSLDNALVVSDEKVLNSGGLRNSKEFVNHKILDLAGDLFLSGYNILGKINCNGGGHQLTNLFLREFLDNNKQKFEIKEFKSERIRQISQKNNSSNLVVNA